MVCIIDASLCEGDLARKRSRCERVVSPSGGALVQTPQLRLKPPRPAAERVGL